jgi:hypothetical protein
MQQRTCWRPLSRQTGSCCCPAGGKLAASLEPRAPALMAARAAARGAQRGTCWPRPGPRSAPAHLRRCAHLGGEQLPLQLPGAARLGPHVGVVAVHELHGPDGARQRRQLACAALPLGRRQPARVLGPQPELLGEGVEDVVNLLPGPGRSIGVRGVGWMVAWCGCGAECGARSSLSIEKGKHALHGVIMSHYSSAPAATHLVVLLGAVGQAGAKHALDVLLHEGQVGRLLPGSSLAVRGATGALLVVLASQFGLQAAAGGRRRGRWGRIGSQMPQRETGRNQPAAAVAETA